MMAHRVTANNCLYAASPRSPLHLRSSIVRSRPQHISQVRQLWWWGRHGNEWSSSFDENMEERVRRQHRILRHRYSKMLRRRALWERDYGCRLSWPWRLSHRWLGGYLSDVHNMSSTQASRSKVEEQREEDSSRDSPLATFHKDFESFKKAVDRAIERDPYGTLFGRRLQSPPSNNNSSWTSFSWIFDPKEIKDNAETENEESKSPKPDSPKPVSTKPVRHDDLQPTNSGPIPTTQSVATDEYEYDPISMRKVRKSKFESSEPAREGLKPKPEPSEPPKTTPRSKAASAEPSRKTFFDALFSENGVEIPVKTYKPHKVYGYGIEPKKDKPSETESQKRKVGFETSRKRELNALKAATLGNTIDTTAEYGGKYSTKQEPAYQQLSPKARAQAEPSDDTPLFSGTTYERRSSAILTSRQPKSEWLRKEGFSVDVTNDGEAVDIPVKKFKPKSESSVERPESNAQMHHKTSSVKLQPALDRQSAPTGTKSSPVEKAAEGTAIENPEDLEFLRASDVRAATRSARVSKQEKQQQKVDALKKLEDDFSARRVEMDELDVGVWGRSKMSKTLDTVWKHVRDYPDGIVAKTMKSMGVFNDNWKKYIRPDKPKTNLNEKLVFKDESLSQVSSIHKPARKSSQSFNFMPSKEVIEAEKLNQERTRVLQHANDLAKERADAETTKANELARDLRREYETEYGKINVRHRQVKEEDLDRRQPVPDQVTDTAKPHPLSMATVKEGVPRYPSIESHVSKFEPEFARLVEEAKLVRRELHEAKIHFRGLRDRLNISPWNEIESIGKTEVKSELASTDQPEDTSAQGSDDPVVAQPVSSTALDDAAHPVTVEEPVFTPEGSPIWNDEQPPPISELKNVFTSSYVILKYNSETNAVTRLPANFHEADSGQPSAPLEILSRLQHAEKFFPHFSALEAANYEIISSDSDTLIFRKAKGPSVVTQDNAVSRDSVSTLQNSTPLQKDAATVLDEIPIEIDPSPGPAAPTAPPTSPATKPTTAPSLKPKVKRQEDVFSGTRRPVANPIDPETSQSLASSQSAFDEAPDIPASDSTLRRFLRTINRIILGTLTVGVGAYVVGVITEGLDAKAQQRAILNGDGEKGPRKKIVLTSPAPGRTRPGIFSTEDSR